MRVADYIIDFLAKNSVRDIFVLTGHGAMYLNDAIVSHKKIHYFCARHETTAAIMAEGYARLKGQLGVICVTAGPGSTNVIPGLAEAFVDNAPILVLSGQVPRRHTTYVAKIPGLRTFGTAEINIVPIVSPLTKYAETVVDPQTIRYHLEKAVYLALSGKPGPVWLDIPLDVQAAEINPHKLKSFKPPNEIVQQVKKESISKVIKLLQSAKRPLIIAGHGIRQAEALTEFKELVETLKIPVVLTRLGIDILPFSNPYNFGLGGVRGNKFSGKIMKQADLILVLGSRLSIPVVGYDLEVFDKEVQIVVVDIDKAELEKPGVKINLALNYHLKPFLQQLLRSPLPNSFEWKEWLKDCQTLKDRYPMVTPDMKQTPIDLYYFMSRLDALSKKNHIFTSDSGSNYYIAGQVYRFEQNQREISSIAFGAMGLTIPLAVGASIAAPSFQVLAVTGDGSLELNIQDLKTISFYDLNIKLFVINNGGYVSMRNWQDTFFKGRRIGADDKSGVGLLNLKNVALAFDLPYQKISKHQEVDHKLTALIKTKGPVFVEVICRQDQTLLGPILEEGRPNYAS